MNNIYLPALIIPLRHLSKNLKHIYYWEFMLQLASVQILFLTTLFTIVLVPWVSLFYDTLQSSTIYCLSPSWFNLPKYNILHLSELKLHLCFIFLYYMTKTQRV